MAEDFASGLTNGFNSMSRLRSSLARTAISKQRADTYDEMMHDREPLIGAQTDMIKARIAQMPQELQLQQERINNTSLGLKLQALAQQIAQQRLGLSAQAQQNKYSIPHVDQTMTGEQGLYQKPTNSQMTALQKVQDAFPQVVPAMQQIQKGAIYYQNVPGKFKKFVDSTAAYMAGNATPEQVRLLTDAGISKDALIQAAETAQRTFGFPKTNEGMRSAFELFTPTKGQTPQSFIDSQQQLLKNLESRYWQSIYQTTKGMPVNDGSQIGANSLKDMNNFVDTQLGKGVFGTIHSDSGSSNNDINEIAGKLNTTPYQVKKAIKQLMDKGYSKEQAMETLKNG